MYKKNKELIDLFNKINNSIESTIYNDDNSLATKKIKESINTVRKCEGLNYSEHSYSMGDLKSMKESIKKYKDCLNEFSTELDNFVKNDERSIDFKIVSLSDIYDDISSKSSLSLSTLKNFNNTLKIFSNEAGKDLIAKENIDNKSIDLESSLENFENKRKLKP